MPFLQPNHMELKFSSRSENESLARVAVGAFVSQSNPTMDEISEIQTVVSEAVTNAIIHGYEDGGENFVMVTCSINAYEFILTVEDNGRGICDIEEARQPLFTSKPELERSGMGFTIMEEFMDDILITSVPGQGTKVRLSKTLRTAEQAVK